jgi:hypothetical protein
VKRRLAIVTVVTACSIAVASAGQRLATKGDPRPKAASTDATYGYSESNPIMVGEQNGGPQDERTFLDALRGPDGQQVTYKRVGSCCPFKTPNALIGDAVLLDKFEVTYQGLTQPIILYIDMYDYKQPMVPVGFAIPKRK